MLSLAARDTLIPVELDRGEGFSFKLRNGAVRSFVLEDTAAAVILTNCRDTHVEEPRGGTIYHFTCRVRVDGHPMTMERYVCSQECFYHPYVINGMRVWFDAVADIFDLVEETHGPCRPQKQARFAINDAADSICPQVVQPWCPVDWNTLDVGGCYNGDDPWMGPYLGASAHGGLDINQPRGTLLRAPIDLDDHGFYNAVAMGDRNNRWRGVKTWRDGAVWTLGLCHVIRLIAAPHTPLRAGDLVAEGAGVAVGGHDHSHFTFAITDGGRDYLLDPWIIFWQVFENTRGLGRYTHPAMQPARPARTGQPVAFSSAGSHAGRYRGELEYAWTFGDGGCSHEANPTHTFARPGIYPVTLTVRANGLFGARTQHITVDGEPVGAPALTLAAPDEPAFRLRPIQMTDTHGLPPRSMPHMLVFTARYDANGIGRNGEKEKRGREPVEEVWPGGEAVCLFPELGRAPERSDGLLHNSGAKAKIILLRNIGGGTLARPTVDADPGLLADRLSISGTGRGNEQALEIGIRPHGLAPGTHATVLRVRCDGALNSPQPLRILLNVTAERPRPQVTVDDRDDGFYSTPHFWVAPRFNHWLEKPFGGFYLTNGGRPADGEFARFTPDLRAGRYEVSFGDRTPFREGTRFAVRVRHANGDDTVWVEPARSLIIGTFDFDEGTDGFVELLAAGSTGQVFADAVTFRPVSQ